MRKHRSYPIEFKRQVAQEYLAGETLHGLAKRHEISRNLVRIWVVKYEAGYRAELEKHGLKGSMGRRGNPYDNAKAESFMKTLKVERFI